MKDGEVRSDRSKAKMDVLPLLEISSYMLGNSNKNNKAHLAVRFSLRYGLLIRNVKLKEREVSFYFGGEYCKKINFSAINDDFLDLYHSSDEFQKVFEKPLQGDHQPSLFLKDDSQLLNAQDVQNLLVKLAAKHPKPLDPIYYRSGNKFNVYKLIKSGVLFAGVEFDARKAMLVVNPEFNLNENDFEVINLYLFNLYKKNEELKMYFEEPKMGSHQPYLMMRHEIHGFTNESLLQSLKYFSNYEKRFFQDISKHLLDLGMPMFSTSPNDLELTSLYQEVDPTLFDNMSDEQFQKYVDDYLSLPHQGLILCYRHSENKSINDSDIGSNKSTRDDRKKFKKN